MRIDTWRGLVATVVAVALVVAPLPVLASPAAEKEMGEEFLVEARRQIPLIDDYEINLLVRDIGQRLVAVLGDQPFDYEFMVVRADDLNAFAVPGGKLFVHSGLIARVDSEDELAGVLGHEVAHSHAHHIVRQQKKAAAANYASLLGLLLVAVHPGLAAAAMAAGQVASLRYSRDFEREADYLGVGYAREAGFDDGGIMHLLQKIWSEQQNFTATPPPYLLSHPLSGERLTNLEAVLGKNEWGGAPSKPTHRLLRAAAIARAHGQRRSKAVPDYERRLAQAEGPEEQALALELIGLLMAHGEDWSAAEGYLERAEKAGRNVDRELGRVYFRRGNLDQAEVRLDRAVAATPADWNALADRGALHYQRGEHAKAEQVLLRSLELYPHSAETARSLGRVLGKSGKEGEGFRWFAKAAVMDGRFDQAVNYYERALEKSAEDDARREELEAALEKAKEDRGRVFPVPGRRFGTSSGHMKGRLVNEALAPLDSVGLTAP